MVLTGSSTGFKVLVSVAGLLGVTTGLVTIDIYRRKPSSSFSFKSLLFVYLTNCWVIPILGKRVIKRILGNTKNVKKCQEGALFSILKRNANTVYGRLYGLKDIKSVDEFRGMHPLTKYDHYEPYMSRIIDDNEPDVLFPGRPIYVGLTSGTTAKNKRFAYPADVLQEYLYTQCFAIFHTDGYMDLKRSLIVLIKPKVTLTKHGVRTGPFTGIIERKNPKFTSGLDLSYKTTDERTIFYVTAVVGLIEKDLTFISFGFCAMAQGFFKTLLIDWENICNDIRNGTLHDSLDIDPSDREFVLHSFKKNPTRADELEEIFKQGFKGILPKLFPNVKRIWLLRSGTFKPAADQLVDEYFGGCDAWSPFHIGTEGCYGLNLLLDAKTEHMTPPYNNAFFEYIPVENVEEDQPKTVLLHEVEMNKEYEVVVTNDRAIYRYRVGDVVKVAGFKDQLPQFIMQYRIGQMLNLYWEKTSEGVFTESLQKSMERLPRFRIVDYTATENEHHDRVTENISSKRHYILFIELETSDNSDESLTQEDKEIFDATLIKKSLMLL